MNPSQISQVITEDIHVHNGMLLEFSSELGNTSITNQRAGYGSNKEPGSSPPIAALNPSLKSSRSNFAKQNTSNSSMPMQTVGELGFRAQPDPMTALYGFNVDLAVKKIDVAIQHWLDVDSLQGTDNVTKLENFKKGIVSRKESIDVLLKLISKRERRIKFRENQAVQIFKNSRAEGADPILKKEYENVKLDIKNDKKALDAQNQQLSVAKQDLTAYWKKITKQKDQRISQANIN